jgi:hypothetical protein
MAAMEVKSTQVRRAALASAVVVSLAVSIPSFTSRMAWANEAPVLTPDSALAAGLEILGN